MSAFASFVSASVYIVSTPAVSATAIPSSVTQVGIDITLTGGDSALFEGAKGYFVFLGDDSSYGFELPIEFKRSSDGVIGASISSVDPSRLGDVEGAPLVAVVAPDSGAPIKFAAYDKPSWARMPGGKRLVLAH